MNHATVPFRSKETGIALMVRARQQSESNGRTAAGIGYMRCVVEVRCPWFVSVAVRFVYTNLAFVVCAKLLSYA